MDIVEINGGLGNQICQYIFYRHLEIIHKKTNIVLDNTFFLVGKMHNGFELDKIFKNCKLNLLTDKFDNDVIKHMTEIQQDPKGKGEGKGKYKTPNLFLDYGLDMVVVLDEFWHNGTSFHERYQYPGKHYFIFSYHFHKYDYNLRAELDQFDNVYYMGIWLIELYGRDIKKEIEHELQFPELEHQENIDYRDTILASDIAVGLHVRKGDFITVNRDIPDDKYARKVKDLKISLKKSNSPTPTFFIFSDDIPWCKENISKLGFAPNDNITYVVGNDVDERNYIDMQLMTFCDYLIHHRKSSFALSAQLISPKDIIRVPTA